MKTEHKGASEERQAILAKVRRMRKTTNPKKPCGRVLCELEDWIETRVKRFKRRKGGL